MVINETLTDLTPQAAKLHAAVIKKIARSKITTLNENIDNKLKVDIHVISAVLSSFESRLRECEIIYYTYLRDADHAVLSGSSVGLPLMRNVQLTYGSNVLNKDIEINDRIFYREIIDAQFRHFILAMASEYEVIVKLVEILIRKVIVHSPGKRPLSAPLDHYISCLKSLVDLRYRKQDSIYQCVISHETFLNKYLPTISKLRNSYMHGFSINLASDSVSYKVSTFSDPFTASSHELEIDYFSKTIMEESRHFFIDILNALDISIKYHSKFIPA